MMEIFEIKQLNYFYPGQEKPSLNNVSLKIREGEFILLAGPSGSGKSTLARVLSGLIPEFYGGTIQGEVFFKGQNIFQKDKKELRQEVGMVFQDPEKQMVVGQVEQELAFGLENLGLENTLMIRRVHEILNFLDMAPLRNRLTDTLSSGEKQKVAIGSILAMQPRVLILDEPTSQLDPLASQNIFHIARKLNQEYGFTIILIEQRLEECLPLVDRVIFMERGKILWDDSPRNFAQKAVQGHADYLPVIPRLFSKNGGPDIPLMVREARARVQEYGLIKNVSMGDQSSKDAVMTVKNVHFSYELSVLSDFVLRDINFQVNKKERLTILGENGAGKSTLLKILAGILRPVSGRVTIEDTDTHLFSSQERASRIMYLSQNPNDYLFHDTVEEELLYTMRNLGIKNKEIITEILTQLEIDQYRFSYPRDLSVGERQRVALASILVAEPQMILLDEPTRGLDSRVKHNLGDFLKKLVEQKGISIVLVTQDVEFAAEFSDRIILLSEGRILQEGTAREVLNGNLFYSTTINKIFRGIVDGIVSFKQAESLLEKNKHG